MTAELRRLLLEAWEAWFDGDQAEAFVDFAAARLAAAGVRVGTPDALREALDTKPWPWLDEYSGAKGWEEAMDLIRNVLAAPRAEAAPPLLDVKVRASLRAYFRAVDDIRDAGEARGGDPVLIRGMYRDAGARQAKAEKVLREYARLSEAPTPKPEAE